MAWVPDAKKFWRFVYTFRLNVQTWQTDRWTDRQMDGHTDTAWRHRPRLHSIVWQKLHDPRFISFDTLPACDGQTGGQTHPPPAWLSTTKITKLTEVSQCISELYVDNLRETSTREIRSRSGRCLLNVSTTTLYVELPSVYAAYTPDRHYCNTLHVYYIIYNNTSNQSTVTIDNWSLQTAVLCTVG